MSDGKTVNILQAENESQDKKITELREKIYRLEELLLKVMAERDKLQDEVDGYELGYRGFS